MKTFQEIYDFCLLDRTYRYYYNLPYMYKCSIWESKYYFSQIRPYGITRAGNYIFGQARRQLERFTKGQVLDYYFHVHPQTYKITDYGKSNGPLIYIVSHIKGNGVEIEFTHPFTGESVHFISRSHQPYNENGLIEVVKRHIDKSLLFPKGRYLDLQIEYQIPKEKFIEWYKKYSRDLKKQAEYEHTDMIYEYKCRNDISYEDSHNALAMSGVFEDMGIEEFEQNEMTEDFMRMCNI